MHINGRIIMGLIVLAGFVAFPFVYNMGTATEAPQLKYDTPAIQQWEKENGKKQCVEPREFMRAEHMQLLNQWRDSVVRDGNRIYTGLNGKQFTISLQNTCMKCHSNKKEFCDKCHTYMDVNPYCWDCHIAPKENTL
jgi:hypothetical protein